MYEIKFVWNKNKELINIRKHGITFEEAKTIFYYEKLILIHSAVSLEDLKIPPGNRLHKLTDDRKGQFSISINDQWRICFKWVNCNALNVEIVDYH